MKLVEGIEPSFQGSKIDIGDVTLNVADEGDGDAVLLLHGFPDSSRLWRKQIPSLVDAGYRAIAPDLRGFGESDRPEEVQAYDLTLVVQDLCNLLDHLNVDKAHVVGHDWGAITSWAFAGWEPGRTNKLVPITVGHPRAFFPPSPAQALRSWYVMFFQLPVISETALSARDWALFRASFGVSPDIDYYIRDLSRPGALTSALNWYRANARPDRVLRRDPGFERVSAPTMGIWGSKDWALTEKQMTDSEKFVDGPWRYERLEAGHWIPLRRADTLNGLLTGFFSMP